MSKCHCESAPWLMTLMSDKWWCALVCIVIVTVVSVSCGNPSIGGLADRRHSTTSTIESDVPIFWETEYILIDSLSESNRIDSNRESECSSIQYNGLHTFFCVCTSLSVWIADPLLWADLDIVVVFVVYDEIVFIVLWRCRENRIWKQYQLVDYRTMSVQRFALLEMRVALRDICLKYSFLRCSRCIRLLQTVPFTEEVPTAGYAAKYALTSASMRWLPTATKGKQD